MLRADRKTEIHGTYCHFLFDRAKITGQKVVIALSSYVWIFNFIDT